MVKVLKNGQMEHATMVDGMKTKYKDTVNLFMLIKMNTKGNSMLIELMVLEDMYKSAVKRMKAFGQTTNHMEKVSWFLKMAQFTKVNLKMA